MLCHVPNSCKMPAAMMHTCCRQNPRNCTESILHSLSIYFICLQNARGNLNQEAINRRKGPLRNPRSLRRGGSSQLAAAHIRNHSLNITAPIGRIPPTVRVFFTSPSTGPVREGKPAKASRAKPNITAPPPSSPNLPETATQQPRIRYTLGTNIPPVPNTGGFVCSGRLHKIFY